MALTDAELLKLRIKQVTAPKDMGGQWTTEPGSPSDRGPKPTANPKTFGQRLGALARRQKSNVA